MTTIAASLRAELAQESKATRRMLAAIPDDKLDWQPHEKSMPLGRLAGHLVEMAGWAPTLLGEELDFAAGDFSPWIPESTAQLLEKLDENVAGFDRDLDGVEDEALFGTWTMRNGEQILVQMPRLAAFRTFVLNHIVHHRAQLGVYLRLLDVPVPSTYGPSADDQSFG